MVLKASIVFTLLFSWEMAVANIHSKYKIELISDAHEVARGSSVNLYFDYKRLRKDIHDECMQEVKVVKYSLTESPEESLVFYYDTITETMNNPRTENWNITLSGHTKIYPKQCFNFDRFRFRLEIKSFSPDYEGTYIFHYVIGRITTYIHSQWKVNRTIACKIIMSDDVAIPDTDVSMPGP
ncbi:hypothetical protein Btru_069936 [Bulinus truncatus]|nr:hypothetical protein Btru_069936 [Bulinus truncatus]